MVRKRSARNAVLVAAILVACSAIPAAAYDAVVGWEPVTGAAGYRVDLRYDSSAIVTPTDVGLPATASDGVVRTLLRNLAIGPDAHFTVTAYDANGVTGATSAPLMISYAAQAAVSDSDGDGLTDAEEDVNLNGVRDPGETDAYAMDSDGDGISDADEIAAGTDPLAAPPPPPPPPPACPNECGDGMVCDASLATCIPDERVWLVAATESTASWYGAMGRDDAYAGGRDNDTSADALSSQQVFAASTKNAMYGGSGDEVRYSVTLPSAGEWYLWGRFYYPGELSSNDANSFLVRVDGGTAEKFGNKRDAFQTWHWDGDGALENGARMPLALGVLDAGTHEIAIEKREVTPIAPRLELIVFTRDEQWRPTDDAARSALGSRLAPDEPAPPPPPSTTTTSTTTSTTTTSTTTSSTTTSSTTTSSTTTTTLAAVCPSGASCDDGDPCTVGDMCTDGSCSGWALDCSHLDGACSIGICDPLAAECVRALRPVGTVCDDSSACTASDSCSGDGVCRGANACDEESFCDAEAKVCRVRSEVWLFPGLEPTATFYGAMRATAEYADGDDLDPAADSITPALVYADSRRADLRKGDSDDRVVYQVRLPAEGAWYLWARLYYPGRPGSQDANSFFIRVDDGASLRLGDNRDYFQAWHWDGDGAFERGAPRPLPLGMLAAGLHEITIAKREVRPLPPRLDVIVLTQDPDWTPSDNLLVP